VHFDVLCQSNAQTDKYLRILFQTSLFRFSNCKLFIIKRNHTKHTHNKPKRRITANQTIKKSNNNKSFKKKVWKQTVHTRTNIDSTHTRTDTRTPSKENQMEKVFLVTSLQDTMVFCVSFVRTVEEEVVLFCKTLLLSILLIVRIWIVSVLIVCSISSLIFSSHNRLRDRSGYTVNEWCIIWW